MTGRVVHVGYAIDIDSTAAHFALEIEPQSAALFNLGRRGSGRTRPDNPESPPKELR
jgi:hypothetical protein